MKPLKISALAAALAMGTAVLWFWSGGPQDAAVEVAVAPAPLAGEAWEPMHVAEEIAAPVAQAEATPVPLPAEPALALRQDARWVAAVPEREFAGFREWAGRFEKATPQQQMALLSEGRRLVEERRQELSALIDKNPKRALELALPVAVRRALPAEIAARLEEPVRGRGELWVVAAVPVPGAELRVRPVQRTVRMPDGRLFDAFTYGRRADSPTRMDIAIHGITLDGKLALDELPGRVLEPMEVAAAKTGGEICPTSGVATVTLGAEVAVDFGDADPTFFCGPSHAYSALMKAADAEGALPTAGAANSGAIAQSGYTEGTKKMLCIRVDFPDATGQVVSDATLTTLVAAMKTQWENMSYGKASWFAVGSGSAITPTLRMPLASSNYEDFGTFLNAARAVAADAGYNYANYDFDVLFTAGKPIAGFAGIAYVGGRGAWLANGYWSMGVCSHEVGHNFGLNHSGFWDTDDGTVIGNGSAAEYGNPFDHMGGASSSLDAHFSARQKNYLDWLADADVRKIGADGQVLQRISAFDGKAATGFKSIAVDRAGTENDYWIEYRGEYADTNNDMKEGVVLNWGPYGINNAKPLLLDNTPATGSLDDSTVILGRTFSDTAAGIHITPVLRGTDAGTGVRWMDVQVNRGAFAGNQKPTVTVSATNLNPAVNGSVTFTATASDPDNDTLAYFWEWGDGTYTSNNSTTAAHAWTTTGTKTARCRITDMKGQTATGQLLIQVGTSTTFFIQGAVASTLGVPIEGAVVAAGAANDTTDSEGYYAITGLAAGSYTLTATKAGLTINPNGFTNPVVVGPNKQNINFIAPPGSPTFGTMKAALVDQGSSSGAIPLPVSDPDTALTALTLTAVSSNVAIIPNAGITFATVGTTVRTVTAAAAANVGGVVDITITATDPEGSSASYVWPVTVNAKPVITLAAQTLAENTALDVDLRTMVADDLTADDALKFEIARVRGGTATLLADGHTARFTPAANYHGAASFFLTTRDPSLSSRTQMLFDFEPPDTTADGKISDQSNFNRIGSFEVAGTGGEYSYTADVPPVLAPFSAQSASLTEAGTGASRFRKTFAVTELNWNDEDWSLSVWFKRASRDSMDTIFHLGDGDGSGTAAELHLHLLANSDALVLGKYSTAGVVATVVGRDVAVGTWHHAAVRYDRTATNTGTLSLYVDGFLSGTTAAIAMDVNQARSLYIGGTADNAANLDRWFDGKFDDVMLASSALTHAEVWSLAHLGTRYSLGLNATATVAVTVTGANQAPVVSDVANVGLFVGQASPVQSFTVSDAETEGRAISVTATSSNALLVPSANIALSAAPAVWSNGDLGTVSAAGSLIEDHGTFIIAGSGAGIGGTADEFRWVREDLGGDGKFSARVVSMDYASDNAKAGVMLREASAAGSAFAYAYVTPAGGVSFMVRASTGVAATTVATVNEIAAPCWLRVARAGTSYTAFYATDVAGTPGPWQPLGTAQTLAFTAAPNRLGMAVTSNADGTLCTAVFDKLGGSAQLGGERTVTVTPAVGQEGTATITLTANDGTTTGTDTFTFTVSPNTPPTMDSVANVTGTDGVGVPTFTINVGDMHTPDALTVTATSSNGLLLPAGRIIITGTGTTRTVQLVPIPSETGTATVTLTVSDGTLTSQRTFTFTVGTGDPSYFIRAGANWRFLDTGVNPANWQTSAFADTAWPVGPAQLGFGEADETTAVNATASRIVTYFRHPFTVADPSQWAYLKVRILRDDGAVLYLNGAEIYRSNVAPGVITGSTQAILSAVENEWEEVYLVAPPLVAGTNVLAVSLHQKGTTSSDLSFDLEVRGYGHSPSPTVAAGADWHFLDDGTDPGATWMASAFAETVAWKTGPAQLGYGDADEATLINSGPSGAYFITTYFRKKFVVANPANFDQAAIRLLRDDGAIVYLNGVELFRDNMPADPITALTPATTSIATAAENTRIVHRFNPALLLTGENIIAVEIHQASATSTDVSFDLELLAYAPNSVPKPVTSVTPTTVTLTWPNWAATWAIRSTSDFATWTPVAATPVDNGNGTVTATIPRTGTSKFYRLEAQ